MLKENEYLKVGAGMCSNTGRHLGFSVYHKKTNLIIFHDKINLPLVNGVFEAIKHLDWDKDTVEEIENDKELVDEFKEIMKILWRG